MKSCVLYGLHVTQYEHCTNQYYKIDDDSVLKQWDMKKVYCYTMRESFVADATFMLTDLLIAGQEVSNGNATLKYNWQ